MRNVSKWAGLTLTCFACLFYPVYESNALTDDTGIIAGLNRDVNTYEYLNNYNYHRWQPDNRCVYASQDNKVLITVTYDQSRLTSAFILGGDYTTDKGIKVGDSAEDVIAAYGPVYKDYNKWRYANTGELHTYKGGHYEQAHLGGYIEYAYSDIRNSGIYFIINKHTQKVVLIMYQSNRHGASNGVPSAEFYGLLPMLD